jgi:uncharacterized damage-inducible protein DinB
MNLADFRRLFTYDTWANREVLAALQAVASAPPRSVQLVAHILSAERLWFERLHGDKPSLPVWPEFSLERCELELAELGELCTRDFASSSEGDLSRTVTYENSKGQTWSSTKSDILMHVFMHSVYHRGQIAADMRGAGLTPAYTDFIHSIRQGFVE